MYPVLLSPGCTCQSVLHPEGSVEPFCGICGLGALLCLVFAAATRASPPFAFMLRALGPSLRSHRAGSGGGTLGREDEKLRQEEKH